MKMPKKWRQLLCIAMCAAANQVSQTSEKILRKSIFMLKNVLKIVQLQNDTGYRYKDEAMMICQKDTMPVEIDGNGKVN